MEARRQPPRIEKIRLDTLRVPPAGQAQRPFREAKGDRIAAEFDINNFGLPVVCRVNGTNWVVDGQHRAYAIQKCGYAKATDTVECEVYEGLSMTEMARMFLGRNRSTPVTAFERFGVAVTAGYPTEGAITKIVESLGLKVGYPKTEGNVYSVGALRRVYDRYGADTLERVLRVLRDAYQNSPAGLGRQVIDGVGLVIATYAALDDKLLPIPSLPSVVPTVSPPCPAAAPPSAGAGSPSSMTPTRMRGRRGRLMSASRSSSPMASSGSRRPRRGAGPHGCPGRTCWPTVRQPLQRVLSQLSMCRTGVALPAAQRADIVAQRGGGRSHAGDRLALDHRRRHRQRQPRRGVVGQLDRAALELGGDDLRRSDERLPTGAPGGCRLGLKLLAVR